MFLELYYSPYFFASHAVQELVEAGEVAFLELEKVYRQSDPAFIGLLNAVRNRSVTDRDLKYLNARVQQPTKEAIVLTSVNAAAEALNDLRLDELSGVEKVFHGQFHGSFPEREAPTDIELRLKKGARVMCVANDPNGRFVNGSLGEVIDFKNEAESDTTVVVKMDEGNTITVSTHMWTIYCSVYDKKTRTLDQEKLGSFHQLPLKLAWAVTIHKSQGKTFDRVTIDLGNGAFAAGQTYVALSRCRSFEGIVLVKPVKLQDIRLDYSIVRFVTSLQYQLSADEMSPEEKREVLQRAIQFKKRIKIVYLKGKDEKSERVIIPKAIKQDAYKDIVFWRYAPGVN